MASSKAAMANTTVTSRRTTNGSRAGVRKKKDFASKSSTSEATKTRLIEIRLRRNAPRGFMDDLRSRYAEWIVSITEDDELIDLAETPQWKEFASNQTAGKWLAGLRETSGWTQNELGGRLGGVSPARISDWEHDRRTISKDFAKKLSKLFGVPAERFIY
jgi:hypothetical protein